MGNSVVVHCTVQRMLENFKADQHCRINSCVGQSGEWHNTLRTYDKLQREYQVEQYCSL